MLLMLWPGFNPAFAVQDQQLLGTWEYDGFQYDSHRYPNPNPDFHLTFEFDAAGVSRLHWFRENESGFCERLADYKVVDSHLLQKVTWLNPENDSTCASDPEMRFGPQTDTVFSIQGDELWLHLDLNEKPFYYILRKLTAE